MIALPHVVSRAECFDCRPFALFETVVTRLRAKLDAVTQELGQPEVIMYTNECNDNLDSWPHVPLAMDYISIDYYTDPTNTPEPAWCATVNRSSAYLYPVPKRVCHSSEVSTVKSALRHELYPKLRITNRTWGVRKPLPAVSDYRHQGVLLVPGISTTCSGPPGSCAGMEDVIVKKLDEYWQWAQEDWLVGGFMPVS